LTWQRQPWLQILGKGCLILIEVAVLKPVVNERRLAMKNKWFLWLVAILIGAALAFSPATFAAEKGEKAEKKEGVKEKKEELREKIKEKREERKEKRKEVKEKIKEKREEMKEKMKEKREEMKEKHEEMKEKMKEKHEGMKEMKEKKGQKKG